jgi:toxin CptA
MRSAPAIVFDYRASRWLAVALAAVTILAFGAVLVSGLRATATIVAALLVAAVAARGFATLRDGQPARCAWLEGGDWRVRKGDGDERAAALVSAQVLGPVIVIVLRLQPERGSLALVLLPDNADADLRRRLRVRLAARREIGADS